MINNPPEYWLPRESIPIGTTWVLTEEGMWNPPVRGLYEIDIHGGGWGGLVVDGYDEMEYGPWKVTAGGPGFGKSYVRTLNPETDYLIVDTVGIGVPGETVQENSDSYIHMPNSDNRTMCVVWRDDGSGHEVFDSDSDDGGVFMLVVSPDGIYPYNGFTDKCGNLATGGAYHLGYQVQPFVAGGLGNKNKPEQLYGNGGAVINGVPQDGQPGAVIITYLGE